MTLPKVAYLLMAYNPWLYTRGIQNAFDQDYPNNLKTVFLLLQNIQMADEIFARYTFQGMDIVPYCLDGEWPKLWTDKLKAFIDINDKPITIWWDEDDYFPHDYTKSVIHIPHEGDYTPPVASWNYWNWEVKRGRIEKVKYRSPIGCMACRTETLRPVYDRLLERFPAGTSGGTGALDHRFWTYYQEIYEGRIYERGPDDPLRFYHFHSGAQTRGGRKPEENIDYGWSGYVTP